MCKKLGVCNPHRVGIARSAGCSATSNLVSLGLLGFVRYKRRVSSAHSCVV